MKKSQYFISKTNYNKEVVYLNCESVNGYKVNPKSYLDYNGIKINEMIIIKPSLAEKIIKRKVKTKLDLFLQFLINKEDDEDSSRMALDELERFKTILRKKYEIYLDKKYLELLNKKIKLIEFELINSIQLENIELETKKRR